MPPILHLKICFYEEDLQMEEKTNPISLNALQLPQYGFM